MIHLIVALLAEARPLIEHLDLRAHTVTGLFKHYSNQSATISLTLSGIGTNNAAAATTETFHLYPEKQHGWLNIGVAGHRSHALGSGFLIGKLSGAHHRQVWYPQILFDSPLPIAELISCTQATRPYTDSIQDMEATGFYGMASRVSTYELIHVIKVISDNQDHPVCAVRPALASKLIAARLTDIDICIQRIRDLQGRLYHEPADGQFEILVNRYHLSVCQQERLRRILARWRLLEPDRTPETMVNRQEGAQQMLERLTLYLDQKPVDFNHV